MSRGFAYLAGGRLHFARGDAPVQAFDSPFALSVRQRHVEIQKRHDWKAQGRGAQWGNLLWGMSHQDPEAMPIAITTMGRAGEGGLHYAVRTGGLTGVCTIGPDGVERRLLHGSERRLQHLSSAGPDGRVACSVLHKDASASIAVMTAEAADLTEVTEGDSQDQAPSWAPDGARIVYQSAGIGRDRQGRPLGLGPFEIHELDLAGGEVRTLASDPARDLLGPKLDGQGTLYYIRRPYRRLHGASLGRVMLDFVLFPARLLFALFQYLNFFTARYTGRPLTSAGGPQRKGVDVQQMMVWGNLIDAQRAAGEGGDDDPAAVVPRTWELVRQPRGGQADVLARSVLSFDLYPDGEIVYSTGSAVYRLTPDRRRERACVDARIEQVVAL